MIIIKRLAVLTPNFYKIVILVPLEKKL